MGWHKGVAWHADWPSLCVGAHSDFGLITLLTTDQPGLEIENGDGWNGIELEPNCIIVNLGDEMPEVETEGLILSSWCVIHILQELICYLWSSITCKADSRYLV